jgi:hypothetical protein
MDYITAYMAGALALIGLWAIRVPHEEVRIVFMLAIAWPLSIVAIIITMILNATGWDINVEKSPKAFYFRRPTNPEARGFAVTAFWTELQFYAKRKA